MSFEEINIWEFGDRINIKVNTIFLELINSQIRNKFKTKRNAHKKVIERYPIKLGDFRNKLKKRCSCFVDLEIFLELCKLLDIPWEKLQHNIIAYKLRRSHNYIINPKLPIKLTPIFDMLIAHHIADGNVVDPKHNRKPYFSYRNYDPHYMQLYIQKISSLCGKVLQKEPYKDETRSYCPGPLSAILFKRYNLTTRSFLSKEARIPEDIFYKESDYLLAVLIAFIIDEGSVDSGAVVIGLKNPLLTQDLYNICKILGYKSTYKIRTVEGKRMSGQYGYLYILREGVKILWNDYLKLKELYSEIDLGRQGEKIEQSFLIYSRRIQRKKGNKEEILKILEYSSATVNEISGILMMTRQGARYLIHALEREGKIEKYGFVGERNYVYGLKIEDESSIIWYS